jgi:hypothetical protein
MLKRGLAAIIFLILLIHLVNALTLSPTKQEIDFVPNLEKEMKFYVSSNLKNRIIDNYILNDDKHLANLKINVSKVSKEGNYWVFVVMLSLPDKLEPGPHKFYVGAGESSPDELMVTTAIKLQAPIVIYAPYPNEYLEVNLKPNNAKINERVPFEIGIINRGIYPVNAHGKIEIKVKGRIIEIIEINNTLLINPQETKTLKAIWKPNNMPAGKYSANAAVEYGNTGYTNKGEDEQEFRLGDLIVNAINNTDIGYTDSRNRFDIDVESMWNEEIDNVFADVVISSQPKSIEFRIPSYSLKGFQKKTITGYYESFGILPGEYSAFITLRYANKNSTIKSSIKLAEKKVFKLTLVSFIILIICFIALIIILNIIIWLVLIKRGSVRWGKSK